MTSRQSGGSQSTMPLVFTAPVHNDSQASLLLLVNIPSSLFAVSIRFFFMSHSGNNYIMYVRSRRIGLGTTWMKETRYIYIYIYSTIAPGIDVQVDIEHHHFAGGISVVVLFMK